MANFYKSEVITEMREQGLVPVFYHGKKEVVLNVVEACVKGGSRLVEFTNRGEGAADLFGEVLKVARKQYPALILGTGSVKDEITAGIYIGKGTDFIVGPTFNPDVARICNRHAIAYSPGCGSASEISNAEALGAEIIKVFPGDCVGGTGFFKSIHGPSPRTQMMPTGGVSITAESIFKWLTIGKAAALGIGSELIRKDMVESGDFKGIEENVCKALHIIRAVRAKQLAKQGIIFKGVHHFGLPVSDMAGTVELFKKMLGFSIMKEPTSTTFISGGAGAPLEVGPSDKVKDRGHIALEVTDIDKAMKLLEVQGIKFEGEVRISSDGTVKSIYLAKDSFGTTTRVHLYCVYSKEVEELLSDVTSGQKGG